MSSPSKNSSAVQNLYEIPTCTICLQDLSEDLACLGCGHVYHLGCIGQHFEYKGTCPNDQKRASMKQVRTIHFQLIRNTKSNAQLMSILANVDASKKNHVDSLMEEVLKLTQSNQKITTENNSNQLTINKQNSLIDNLRKEIHKFKTENEKLRKEHAHAVKSLESIEGELHQHLKIELGLRSSLSKLQEQEREFEHMRKLTKIVTERSQEIVVYRNQLILQGTSEEEMAKSFYDMLLMKNLQVLRLKEKINELPQKMSEKEVEVASLKLFIDQQRKDLKECNDKKNAERKKYDELKVKYRALTEKAKQKGVKDNDIPEMDDSNGFHTLKKSLSILEPSAQFTLKKPLFGQTTIGGFMSKKKEAQRLVAE